MIDDLIHRTAATWVARLQDSDVTLQETLEWQNWMHADPRHSEAFERLEETWATVAQVSPARIEAALSRPSTANRWWPAAIAATVLVATIAGIGFWGNFHSERGAQMLQTAIGENRNLKLQDGSEVTLGGDSALTVIYSSHERRFELQRGEAYFVVAAETARPFRVVAGDATVVALGTQFNVRRRRDGVAVAVAEGRVMVEPTFSLIRVSSHWLREIVARDEDGTGSEEPVQLDAGKQAVVNERGTGADTALPEAGAVGSWRRGLLSFQSEPLRDVIEDVNRYAPKQIVLGDARIGDLRITGTAVGNNVDEWVGSLESAFGIRATVEDGRVVLTRE